MEDSMNLPNPNVTQPGAALHPRTAMATSLHASPGVYALLLGSGVSTSAGIKTGWGIVKDLVHRAAVAADPDNPQAGEDAASDPEGWWGEHGEGKLGYSTLLAFLAPNAAARQAVLSRYFEADAADREADEKVPGPAHRAVAQLVRRGTIRVILTTNFDRLTERALEDEGIAPQVIHRAGQFDAASPLAHSRATVVKLHGDYLDLQSRNTVDELGFYPPEQDRFLDRVFDEYGLIVCGWSADWDPALVRALEGVRSRRYPMFWSHLTHLGDSARDLAAQHTATLIPGMRADEFFTDLVHRLEALDRLADAPPTREIAVARLKRSLPDPLRRIELFDQVDLATSQVIDRAASSNYPASGDAFIESVSGYRADCDTLLHLLATGVFHDDGRHDDLWIRVAQRLVRIRELNLNGFQPSLEALRHYPALLATWTMGLAAIFARREHFLARLLTEPVFRSSSSLDNLRKPAQFLNPTGILTDPAIHEITNPANGNVWTCPQSHLLRSEGREPFREIEPDDDTYERACDRLEFLASLINQDQNGAPWFGDYMNDDRWGRGNNGFADSIKGEIGPTWPLIEAGAFDDVESAEHAYEGFERYRNENWWKLARVGLVSQ